MEKYENYLKWAKLNFNKDEVTEIKKEFEEIIKHLEILDDVELKDFEIDSKAKTFLRSDVIDKSEFDLSREYIVSAGDVEYDE